jgi:predicted HicB family RNase H-like nuclease
MKERFTLYLEPELKARVKKMADHVGLSINSLMMVILSEFVDEKKQMAMVEYLRGKK